ncbi:SIS domain-containing protein [Microbacterium sp. W4I20]|uniref:D-sedoheptulose-7-phosphate isomerase n=1 Tax=Microbacterium sp. W4I20 TaxID=3042262 RepID=UPI00277F283B|nr:SIS domain-containing protein [Microbacterium sp. W4I20]MDQ0727923.1 D-sedoheptulose 7-phosphate isomerase [Microbacterium sp. W4I20]
MSDWLDEQLDAHIRTATDAAALLPAVKAVGAVLIDAFEKGGTLYTFGNGGSAADAQHFTGEVIGHYRRDRRPLPAVTLSTDATVSTCIANDYAFEDIFSRQVQALARPNDVVAAFTTSGRSQNIVDALAAARANGATTLLFGGGDGGPSLALADHVLLSPSSDTPRIQEMHTFFLHALSEILDAWAAGEELA